MGLVVVRGRGEDMQGGTHTASSFLEVSVLMVHGAGGRDTGVEDRMTPPKPPSKTEFTKNWAQFSIPSLVPHAAPSFSQVLFYFLIPGWGIMADGCSK